MERVHGIGGLFFRAREPKTLAAWYSTHLGVGITPLDYDHPSWQQEAGPTAFEPFPSDTTYFGRREQAWMVNFRVRDLAAMVKQLQTAGIAVEVVAEEYPNGLFARLQDPEGNPIELWQPAGRDALPTV
jgi:glyoxylase I family protein